MGRCPGAVHLDRRQGRAALRVPIPPRRPSTWTARRSGSRFFKSMWGFDYGGGKIGMALVVDRDGSNPRSGQQGPTSFTDTPLPFMPPPLITRHPARRMHWILPFRCMISSTIICTIAHTAVTTSILTDMQQGHQRQPARARGLDRVLSGVAGDARSAPGGGEPHRRTHRLFRRKGHPLRGRVRDRLLCLPGHGSGLDIQQ